MSGESSRQGESSASQRQTSQPASMIQTNPMVLPVRRQNVACDACRGRKIRCNRQAGSAKCDNCLVKQLECTAHYVASLKPKRRRDSLVGPGSNGNGHSRNRHSRGSSDESDSDKDDRRVHKGTKRRKSLIEPETNGHLHKPALGLPPDPRHHLPVRPHDPGSSSATTMHPHPYAQMFNLLRYLFSPQPVHHAEFGYDDRMIRPCEACKTWDGPPSEAHLRLLNQNEMMDFAADLIETYFQIVHIRLPILDPAHFKARFTQADSHVDGPPPHILLAIVLAFGSLFSEHSIITGDREECSAAMRDELQPGQKRGVRVRSRLTQMVMLRAREVAEVNKAFRVPSIENIQAALLLDALMGENIISPRQYRASWFRVAIDHLKTLGLNKKSIVVTIQNEQIRGCLVFAWWLACLGDAFASAYYRLKPSLNEDDYDVEEPTAPQGNPTGGQTLTPHPLGTLSEYLVWYSANHAQSNICRLFCAGLWIPKVEANGIPLETLSDLTLRISSWRDEHLTKVGVPTVWPSSWDFVAAVTSCAIDSNYHVMWVVLHHAIRDFGIRAEDRAVAQPIVDQVASEALHGALRVAALASVLTANNYLRLDPNLLYFAVHEAATFLAHNGREEANACIAGMRQYGILYEAAFSQADDLEAILTAQQARQQAKSFAAGPTPYLPVGQDRLFQPREMGVSMAEFQRETFRADAFNGFQIPADDPRIQSQGFDSFQGMQRSQETPKDYFVSVGVNRR